MQTRSGQARKKRGDGGARRDEILIAAQRLFAQGGADRTTMRNVADAVGISTAAVYGYFPDKNALYDATAEAAFLELGSRFSAAAQNDDPIARLRTMMLAYVQFGIEHADAYAIAFSPSIDTRPGPQLAQTAEFAKHAGSQSFDAFHQAVADVPGLCDGKDSERLARVLWSAGHGLVVLSRSKADALPDPIEMYVETLFQLVMAST